MSLIQNNVSLPFHVYANLRTEFCNNLRAGSNGVIQCVVFGVEAIPDHALGFHVLREDGALVSQVPLHALCHNPVARQMPLPYLCPWDSFGLNLSVTAYDYLAARQISYLAPNRETYSGRYLLTIDFFSNGYSDHPEQHKHLHLLRLDNGNFALQPNNRVRVYDASFTTRLFSWDNPPAIETNRLEWFCEADWKYQATEEIRDASRTENRTNEPDFPTVLTGVDGPDLV